MHNFIMIYGIHPIKYRLEHNSETIKIIYHLKEHCNNRWTIIKNLINKKNVTLSEINKNDFNKLLQEHNLKNVVHQNILAFCENKTMNFFSEKDLSLITVKKKVIILILDHIKDPHNLGACIRNADAAGVDFVIISKDNNVKINSTVEKVASGAVSTVKIIIVTNLARAIIFIKKLGIWVVGMDLTTKNIIYDIQLQDSCALILGEEKKGLRKLTRKLCDFLTKIPMYGTISSLNVSVACGIALYEIIRQRRKIIR